MNVHDMIGWDRCANVNCRRDLTVDHVVLLTTTHMRRFCSVECVIDGKQAWDDAVFRGVFDELLLREDRRSGQRSREGEES